MGLWHSKADVKGCEGESREKVSGQRWRLTPFLPHHHHHSPSGQGLYAGSGEDMSLIKVTSGFTRILRSPLQIFKVSQALPLCPQEQTKSPG